MNVSILISEGLAIVTLTTSSRTLLELLVIKKNIDQ